MTAVTDREKREAREIEKMKEAFSAPRPGGLRASLAETGAESTLARHGIELSDILYLRTDSLKPNPNNEYPPLEPDEMAELVQDIGEKGILVPLITKPDGVIVCGHNRHRAAQEAGLERIPVQQIVSAISAELEKDIMKSENDRRRGGKWSKEQKEKFIREKFGAELATDNRGGDFGNQHTGGKSSLNFSQGQSDLAKKIEKQSRGRITAGTAKRIVADLRKKAPKKPDSRSASLSVKERRRAEKLAARLETLRRLRSVLETKLENVKQEERNVLRDMKSFGVHA
jgi:hypothetical protein